MELDRPAIALDAGEGSCLAVALYLARLAPGSRVSQRDALDRAARILAPGADAARIPWHRLTYATATGLRAELLARHAPATVRATLAALRGVLRECWRQGLTSAEEYARATDLATVRGSRAPRGRDVAAGELAALLAACDVREAAALALLYGCGLRRGELVALDVADVDPAARTVRVRHGKGDKERIVPMPGGTARAVALYLDAEARDAGPLVHSRDRSCSVPSRLTGPGVRVMLRRIAARARVAELSPHDLRRAYVGDLLDAGADLSTVAKMCGHTSTDVTARYDRRDDRAARSAADRLHVPSR